MIDKRTETQASLYVLGALPPVEARAFEADLRADPKLRLLVKELRGTAGAKVAAFPQADPPPGLQQRVPSAIDHRPAAPAGGIAPDDGSSASWAGWTPWALAACFAILCVALVSIGRSLREQAVALNQQLGEKNLRTAELQQQLDQLQSQADHQTTNYQTRLVEAQKEFLQRIAEINRQAAARTNQLHQEKADAQRQMMIYRNQAEQLQKEKKALEDAFIATAASDRLASSRIAVLRPTADGPPGVVGASVWSPQDQRGLLVLEGIPPPLPSQAYQLWLFDPALRAPVSGGVLQVGPGGSVRLQFAAPVRVEKAERFAISVEPVGGVAMPTGKTIMTGN
ncbi:MAG TPA: anti-sigma factor [Gemmatimonadales bacterium]|jgi:anti-sigma-K factor RskA|nr:anti-sigma factor [Gemmatimonadales bacterium]